MSMSPELRAALDAIGPEPQMPQWLDQQELQTYALRWSARIEAQRDALLVALREAQGELNFCRVFVSTREKIAPVGMKLYDDLRADIAKTLAKCGDAP